jgi:hypothetical protein
VSDRAATRHERPWSFGAAEAWSGSVLAMPS